jgi:hypothetical protein
MGGESSGTSWNFRGSIEFPAIKPCVKGGEMALQLAIISLLAGIALGLRCKVFVLVPAITLAMIFAVVAGVAHGDQLGSIILAMVIFATAVQFGYLAGVAIHAAAGSISAFIGRNPQLNSQTGRM